MKKIEKHKKNLPAGFTLLEVIIVVSILSFLAAIVVGDFILFQKRSALDNDTQEVVAVLKLAQNKTLSSENDSQYGVYLDASVSPNKYTLFKGSVFASRDSSFDQPHFLSANVEFFGISLPGGNEIAFNKLTGSALRPSNFSLRVKSDTSLNKTVYVSGNGTIGFSSPQIPSDVSRIKDSRHVHFDYSRVIDTANETLTLTFNGNVDDVIPISSYLVGGEIDWQGTVIVGGTNQTFHVHTHKLNSPDTQFSIHRDRRLNDKSLAIKISGDNSGNLLQYSADGLTVNGLTSANCSSGASGLSINVSNCLWQ